MAQKNISPMGHLSGDRPYDPQADSVSKCGIEVGDLGGNKDRGADPSLVDSPQPSTYREEVLRIKSFGRQNPSAEEILKFCADPSPLLTRLMYKHGMLEHILKGVETVQDSAYLKLLRGAWPKGVPMSAAGLTMLNADHQEAETTPEMQADQSDAVSSLFNDPLLTGVQEDTVLREKYGHERYAEALAYTRAFEVCLNGRLDLLLVPDDCPHHQRAIKFVRAFHKKLMEEEKAEEGQSEMDPYELWDDTEVPPSPQPETAHMKDPFKDLMVKQPSVKDTPEQAAKSDALLKEKGWLSTKDFSPRTPNALPKLKTPRPSSLQVEVQKTPPPTPYSSDGEDKPLTIDIPPPGDSLIARRMRLLKAHLMKKKAISPTSPHVPVMSDIRDAGERQDVGKSVTLTRGGKGRQQPRTEHYKPEVFVISDSEEEPDTPRQEAENVYFNPRSGPQKRRRGPSESANDGEIDAKKGRLRMTLNMPLPTHKYLTKAFYNGDTVYTRRFGERGIYAILTTRNGGEGFIQKNVNGRVVASMFLTMTGIKQLYQNAKLIEHSFKKLQNKQYFKPLRQTLEKGKTILIKYPYTTFNIRDWEAKQYGKFAFRGAEVFEFVEFLLEDMPKVFLPLADVEVFRPDE